MAFRKAYELTGGMVKELIAKEKDFRDVDAVRLMLKKSGVDVSSDVLVETLDPKKVVSRNNSLGGTSPVEVRKMVKEFREGLRSFDSELKKKSGKVEAAKKLTAKLVKGFA